MPPFVLGIKGLDDWFNWLNEHVVNACVTLAARQPLGLPFLLQIVAHCGNTVRPTSQPSANVLNASIDYMEIRKIALFVHTASLFGNDHFGEENQLLLDNLHIGVFKQRDLNHTQVSHFNRIAVMWDFQDSDSCQFILYNI